MSEKNEKKQVPETAGKFSFSEFIRKKQVIAGIIIIFIILIIILSIVFANSKKTDNNTVKKQQPSTPTAEATKKPIQLPSTSAAVTPTEQVITTPEHTDESQSISPATSAPAPTAQPSFRPKEEEAMNEILENSNAEAGIKAIKQKEEALSNHDKFESYIQNKDYNSAKELLDNFFKNDEYSNLSLITYKNYVQFYEAQELYNDSAMYQLDYIEQMDGLENVREESMHYKTLMSTLEKIPDFTDNRIDSIKSSAATWKEMTDYINSNNYETVISRTKELIKNGNESVTAYLYLTQALNFQEEYFETAKVYYCYLGKDTSNMNQLEMSYYYMFVDSINMMHYNDKLTSDEVDYLESEFDYANYLK